MSIEVNIHEAKTHLSRLLAQALAGEEVIIMRSGRPLVRLLPVATAPTPRVLGTAKCKVTMREDFDAPLPEDILETFER